MPSWNIHLEAGERLANKLRLEPKSRREFLVGCLLPDINNGYINSPKYSRPHEETHYAYDQKSSLNFYAENRSEIEKRTPIFLGYLFHLYTDGFFNYDFYRTIKRSPLGEGKTHKEKAAIKHHDFWLYDTNFHHELDADAKSATDIAQKANQISAVHITADDILDVKAILARDDLNDNIKGDEYIFYTRESLDNLLEDMIESFTNDYLRNEEEHA
ncbi:zinc dependent phospholipase C family protein [Candidatus Saccharibacteria bacterium]|nr:zinc dependent phospholipase C family protein [Candidatus Saccharibacteria bacterium]